MIQTKQTFTDTGDGLELERGRKFKVNPGSVKSGQLCLFNVNGLLTIGRYFGVAGVCSWIIQPGRWVDCAGADVKVIGLIKT
jgi:hypothetical protein